MYQSLARIDTVGEGNTPSGVLAPKDCLTMMSALNTEDGEQGKTTGLDQDTIHELLSNSRRRAVLELLAQHDSLDKSDLSEHVASIEYGKPIDELTSQERKRVYISLTQSHLDRLEEANVIKSNGEVSLTENADALLWHLEGPTQNLCDKAKKFVEDLF